MAEQMTSDVRMLLDREPFDAAAVADLREVLGRDPSRYRTLRDAAAALKDRVKGKMTADTHLRLGVADVLLGRHRAGLEHLEQVGEHGLAHFFRGLALEHLMRWHEAAQAFAAAAKAGYEPKLSELHRAGMLRRAGDPDAARAILAKLENLAGSSAEYHYQRGCLWIADNERVAATAEFERALELDPGHTRALFEMAYINDLYGNDETAVEYYRRCLQRPPVPLAALVNLGILYEDELNFREAERCYQRVLGYDPNHPRARLFVRDCRASKDMYIDEDEVRNNALLSSLMQIPVTDFELSVRSRNCLKKMNIRTLGDLTRTTEQALLSSKNFGETSLSEIKEIMASKGLRLGLALESNDHDEATTTASPRYEPHQELTHEERAKLAKPISELNLSVRARKCMNKLGIQTVGELAMRTGDELLDCKNFGVTSLNEVREKLTQIGLKLRNE